MWFGSTDFQIRSAFAAVWWIARQLRRSGHPMNNTQLRCCEKQLHLSQQVIGRARFR